jgi:hypothetical protein
MPPMNSHASRITAPYVPAGHYIAWTVTNQPSVTRAYPLDEGETLPALLRLAKHAANMDLPPDVLRLRARHLLARIEATRLWGARAAGNQVQASR